MKEGSTSVAGEKERERGVSPEKKREGVWVGEGFFWFFFFF